jgi:hypothetical protein
MADGWTACFLSRNIVVDEYQLANKMGCFEQLWNYTIGIYALYRLADLAGQPG